MTTEVEVDRSRCVASGNRVAIAPTVFDQSEDDGTVPLLDATPPEHERERVREASLVCPAAAIVLHEHTSARRE
ncbi:ferredoxin [Goodfellowiella coeruleoviolacea]|uniref:Ferredoxin n=1 Tax=Goodfellowiella coeruleoviolacea TaxID=334858 RepID=A0AAE3KIL5_9PSEU|nr:ferredoxin [Goodfellowiella coeruleoviolacea]MCP2168605.1 Ferredoxin [Goodfellowiella coeruleoviolacea]